MMQLGTVFFVFVPAIFTTPLAGRAVAWLGRRNALFAGLGIAALGLPLLLLPTLPAVLAGLVLISAGTFLAQAVVTGAVGLSAHSERASASGLYLCAYYLGWPATILGIACALCAATAFIARLWADHP